MKVRVVRPMAESGW